MCRTRQKKKKQIQHEANATWHCGTQIMWEQQNGKPITKGEKNKGFGLLLTLGVAVAVVVAVVSIAKNRRQKKIKNNENMDVSVCFNQFSGGGVRMSNAFPTMPCTRGQRAQKE